MKNKWVSEIIIVSFLVLIGWFTLFNFPILLQQLFDFLTHPTDIFTFGNEISEIMKSDNLYHKDDFINLSGLYGRLSGRRLFNEVVLMKNGMLNYSEMKLNAKTYEIPLILSDFSHFVEDSGGKFFYVQYPGKYDKENDLMPEGLSPQIRKEITGLVDLIGKAGVDVLDLHPLIADSMEDIERNYYITDHHWKPTAAFQAFQMIVSHAAELFPDEKFSGDAVNSENWTVHELKDQFLGSFGRRVGIYFRGMDDLQWLTPNFRTKLSFSYPLKDINLEGNFEDTLIRKEYLEPGGDKLHTDYFFVYIGDNYPYFTTKNSMPLSDRKVLLIHDSYSLPVIAFLSTVFREVDAIDPRSYADYYPEMPIKKYVEQTHPDIVIMALSPYPDVINHKNTFHF